VAACKEGVLLIIDKFMKLLKQEGLEKIEAVGKDFDTDYHEAVAMVPGLPEAQKNKVIDCVLEGYMLNDKVIRHAKVAVAQ
jgi:molecular chaperone GrpE